MNSTTAARLGWSLAAGVVYAALSAAVILGRLQHPEWMVILLQLVLLLPALRNLWWKSGGAPASPVLSQRLAIAVFAVVTLAAGYRISQGPLLPDESSYTFQARIFAAGHAKAEAPPGASARPRDTELPLRYVGILASRDGWYSKYPIGWPLLLAPFVRANLAWIVSPLLGVLLLVLIGRIAREAFGASAEPAAVWIAVASPFFAANAVGMMSHALCGVLIAAACLAGLQAARRRSLARFALMFALLVPAFHVRPFTAAVVSAAMGVWALAAMRRDRRIFAGVALLGTCAAVLAFATILLYNRAFTGHAFLSPYALFRGVAVPVEISAGPAVILHNLAICWRMSTQSMLVYTFPFVFPLAAYAWWHERKSQAAWLLGMLLPALAAAYLVQVEPSASAIGERYWFEGYFGIAILAARGALLLLDRKPLSRAALRTGIAVLGLAQLVLTGLALHEMNSIGAPARSVAAAAERERHCHCVVFLADAPPFVPAHMNLNDPDWKHADVFYLIDPGPEDRARWAALYGRSTWKVIGYDPAEE